MSVKAKTVWVVICDNCRVERSIDAVWLGLIGEKYEYIKNITLCSDTCVDEYKIKFIDSGEISTLLIEEWGASK